jgi:hypothetical protein
MKTSEMIAMLERNPKLEFRGKMWDDNDRRYFGVDAEGIMRFFPENSGVLYAGGEFWVEVTKQPESISAGVAIKALQDGKTIHCMIGSERFTYEPDSVYYIPYTHIKYGKWFIKEDNFWRREPCLRATEAEAEVERLRAENALLRKVVRCGECDRRIKSADLTNTVLCGWLHKITMNKDDFCSYGAKMEDRK